MDAEVAEWLAEWVLPFLLPPGVVVVLGLAGVLWLGRGSRASARAVVALALALLWGLSLPVIAETLAAALEDRFPAVRPEDSPECDAIVVLGGGVIPAAAPRLDPDLTAAADRVWWAMRLYRAKKAPLIVLTGAGARGGSSANNEANASRQLLEAWGIAPTALMLETRSRSTAENCQFTAKLLPAGARVLLVTSAIHMPRAMRECATTGMVVTPAPTDFHARSDPSGGAAGRWLPSARALRLSADVLKEQLALRIAPSEHPPATSAPSPRGD